MQRMHILFLPIHGKSIKYPLVALHIKTNKNINTSKWIHVKNNLS